MIYLAEQFPDLANFFPVLRKIFPVNLPRDLREKSLQRSGFQLRNSFPEPQNRETQQDRTYSRCQMPPRTFLPASRY
jgi:hypothetical protein